MLRSIVLPVCVLSMSLTPLRAQQLSGADFVIPDTQTRIAIDLAAVRELGVWTELETSVLGPVLKRIEKELGFPLVGLDRFGVSLRQPTGAGPLGGQQVLVWEGNRELAVPESYLGAPWQAERIESFEVRRRPRTRGEELFVKVNPGLLVHGQADCVEPVLRGKQRATAMPPDLQSLLSGRERRLGWIVLDLAAEAARDRFLVQVLGAELSAWPASELPTHLSAQILVAGEAAEPHLEVRVVLRHAKDGDGVAVSQRALDSRVAKMREDARMQRIQPLLARAAAVRDATDAVVQVDFGPVHDAVAGIATLLLPVLGRGSEVDAKPQPEKAAGGK
ncbi:MAG: hypothetical protein MUC36_09085 [Planctomycetes bacterium]|nr:hypothetical protein [Planctomycetota bacterium]